jgi:lysozyme family protein
MSESRFTTSLQFVLKWEGGYVNDPADPGGATNMGVTQKTYDAARQQKGLPSQPVRGLTQAEAEDIYRSHYWLPLKCDRLPAALDMVMFDTGVNMGIKEAVKLLQACLQVPADGAWGPHTEEALAAKKDAIPALIDAYLSAREARYREIAQAHPQESKFLSGWLRRVEALKKAVA